MVDAVRDALAGSEVETIVHVVSSDTPATRDHVPEPLIQAPGDGYVADLQHALSVVDPPVLTVGADLPLLTTGDVRSVLETYTGRSVAVYVPTAVKAELGLSIDRRERRAGVAVTPAGVNIVADGTEEDTFLTEAIGFAVNVNRRTDARIAEAVR